MVSRVYDRSFPILVFSGLSHQYYPRRSRCIVCWIIYQSQSKALLYSYCQKPSVGTCKSSCLPDSLQAFSFFFGRQTFYKFTLSNGHLKLSYNVYYNKIYTWHLYIVGISNYRYPCVKNMKQTIVELCFGLKYWNICF